MKVDVEAVEAELARMQRELTNSEVRTSLFNLVVMSPDVQRTMVDEALNYLLGKRAARVIHIVNTSDETSDLQVSARCFVDHEHKGVCFQEVIITNGSDGAGGAPGSWIPLLVRDIPTYILWLDTVCDKVELFSHVQNQSDKIIVDSDQCVALGDDPDELLKTLSRVAVEQGVPLADFSWKRLRPFRRLAAAGFEGERAGLLDEITALRIVGMRPIAGRLFGLWFSERLGWTPAGNEGFRDVRGRAVSVERERTDGECDVAIRIELAGGDSVEIGAGESGCADVEYPGGTTREIVTLPSNGEILLEEVDAVYADDLYRAALAQLTERRLSQKSS
ncbi:MAG: glucose-6-phosphate dehydrogenase assembly protein OpcA [Spirochaetota bacterium]